MQYLTDEQYKTADDLYKMAKAAVTGDKPDLGEHRELEVH